MGRSLLMDKLGFNAADITSTVAVSGLLTLYDPVSAGLAITSGWTADSAHRVLSDQHHQSAILSGSFTLAFLDIDSFNGWRW